MLAVAGNLLNQLISRAEGPLRAQPLHELDLKVLSVQIARKVQHMHLEGGAPGGVDRWTDAVVGDPSPRPAFVHDPYRVNAERWAELGTQCKIGRGETERTPNLLTPDHKTVQHMRPTEAGRRLTNAPFCHRSTHAGAADGRRPEVDGIHHANRNIQHAPQEVCITTATAPEAEVVAEDTSCRPQPTLEDITRESLWLLCREFWCECLHHNLVGTLSSEQVHPIIGSLDSRNTMTGHHHVARTRVERVGHHIAVTRELARRSQQRAMSEMNTVEVADRHHTAPLRQRDLLRSPPHR